MRIKGSVARNALRWEAVIDRYQRTAQNQWILETHQGLDATIEFQTSNLKVAAPDLYDGIKIGASS